MKHSLDRRIAAPLVGLLFALTGWNPPPVLAGTVSAAVTTLIAQPQTLEETMPVYGSVEPDPQASQGLSTAHGGLVTRLWVGLGQVVPAGTPLVTLKTDPAARRDYALAEAQLAFARKNLAQVEALFAQQLATKADLAKAKQGQQDAKSALAALDRNGANLAEQTLRAPHDAIVTRINATTGDRLPAGSQILTLSARHRLWVTLGIEPEDSARIHPGMAVTIQPVFGGHAPVTATIDQVHALINPRTRLVDALVRLKNTQTTGLLAGMAVTARIVLAAHHGIVLPESAIRQDAAGDSVFVVRQGHAVRVSVRTGARAGGRVLITQGLEAGAAVVIVGVDQLQDGMAVRDTPAGGTQ